MSHNLTLSDRDNDCKLEQTPTDLTRKICNLGTREEQFSEYVSWLTRMVHGGLPKAWRHNPHKFRYDPSVQASIERLEYHIMTVRQFMADHPESKFGST